MTDHKSFAPIYARLTEALVRGLMRTKGMSREEAEVAALEHTLNGAQELVAGMADLDELIDEQKKKQ